MPETQFKLVVTTFTLMMTLVAPGRICTTHYKVQTVKA